MATPLLSDSELREKLKLLGEDVGPIIPTTRRVYQKRLDTLLLQQKRCLNALSSDDSETERSNDRNLRKKRVNHRPNPSQSPHTPSRAIEPGVSKENKPLREIFKTPLTTSPRYSALRPSLPGDKNGNSSETYIKTPSSGKPGRRNVGKPKGPNMLPFEVETSDSERDTESLVSPMRTLQLRTTDLNKNKEVPYKRPSRKSFLTSTPNGDDLSPRRNVVQQHEWKKHPVSGFSGIKRFPGYPLNGYVPDTLNGEFQSAKTSGKSTNYSHCVSWMLVLGIVAFFVIIGVFYYMSTAHKSSTTGARNSMDYFQCEFENVPGCIPSEHFNTILTASHTLHSVLSHAAGQFECQTVHRNRNLSVSLARELLRESLDEQKVHCTLPFDQLFQYTVSLTMKNPSWGIKFLSESGEVLNNDRDFSKISALESKHATKSLLCRLQHSVYWTLSNLVLLVLGVVSVYLAIIGCQFWKKRKELQEKEFFNLVDSIIDILQKPLENGPTMPVAHIRDQLIPIKQRKEKSGLWEKAVSFIEENESRVEVDFDRIKGEEHKIWRWLPSPTDESEAGKHGKVWQGQAFGSSSKGKTSVSYSPTPCLKIRNMFDPAVEYGDDWQISVQDAILEKCEGNEGIVHIAIDTSGNEGCTYMLCNSSEAAGKAYDAMHGWWFDGKLVTIKYLRLQRYLERFPGAENYTEPLKPSNNKRLSLSAPFFSSALERS